MKNRIGERKERDGDRDQRSRADNDKCERREEEMIPRERSTPRKDER